MASQFSIGDPEFVDTSSFVGGDFDNSSLKTKTYLLHLGLVYHF